MDHFIAPERLVTDEFVLRCPRPGDGAETCRVTVASHDHLKTFMGWSSPDQTPEAAEDHIRGSRAKWLTNEDFMVQVWAPDEAQLWGGTGFHPRGRPLDDAYAEIGMWIAVDRAGRGLGTKVLEAMLDWGFTEWPWERLEWRCDARNEASAAVARKAGMPLEGTLRGTPSEVGDGRRDEHIFGLTRQDWHERNT